jgi:hypothetical protein
MCHLHCLVFCWLSSVFCHFSKLTPSPLTLVHCHLVFCWALNVFPLHYKPFTLTFIHHLMFQWAFGVFYCSTKPSPLPSCICLSWFCVSIHAFHCFTNSNPPFHMWSLSSYISLFHLMFFVILSNSPHPNSSSLLFCSSWEPKSHCWLSFLFMKCDPSPCHVLLVLWIITMSFQPIPFGLQRVIHLSLFSQFV